MVYTVDHQLAGEGQTMKKKRILVTGAAGYIGSHVVKHLYAAGYRHIWGADFAFDTSPNTKAISPLLEGMFDVNLADDVSHIETGEPFDHIIHLAAFISVEESVKNPGKYWFNNMASTGNIIRMANTWGANLIFASTGTAFDPNNPYAETKIECERLITEMSNVTNTIFRFYNVSGCAEGLSPTGESTHLIRVAAEAVQTGKTMKVFGDDWETVDGTCVRDYIDVRDVAAAIVDSLDRDFVSSREFECLGSGDGFTVLEVLDTMNEIAVEHGKTLRYDIVDRRAGDVGSMICPEEFMYPHLTRKHSLSDMCRSAYTVMGALNGSND